MTEMNKQFQFHSKVFSAPYAPYYDEYRGEVFEIDHVHPEDDEHVFLRCVSNPEIKVKGAVHRDELVEIKDDPFGSEFDALFIKYDKEDVYFGFVVDMDRHFVLLMNSKNPFEVFSVVIQDDFWRAEFENGDVIIFFEHTEPIKDEEDQFTNKITALETFKDSFDFKQIEELLDPERHL